ncbi:MAG: thioredoxin domain-containing protein [Bacteroidetes bacterium]|nr:thioredoxin domain-containing protein [Bacteroidota bacterium]
MNALSTETSPYLLQHQNNPVHWFAWGEEAWRKAREEDKLVLVSIGYSACHWCHVMEHESFEDEATAAIMNEHFICIKVDREERPDVDQVYMEAVQIIHGSGGWPLNCFTLPDGRPVHGGTYFRNTEWKKLLLGLTEFYNSNKDKALDYAARLTHGVKQLKFDSANAPAFTPEKMDSLVLHWQNYFDIIEGGQDREPKFPLPNNYEFLLQFGVLKQNKFILNFLHLTLHKMARGGIYDQVGGGFSRYSVDRLWQVPHFEKMLYDNAQLIGLYSKAYQLTKSLFYLHTMQNSIAFVLRELSHAEGGFYSALDADSEGEEGKFYTWSEEEFLAALAGEEFHIDNFTEHLKLFYQVTYSGNWHEEETNILTRISNTDDFCFEHALDEALFLSDLEKANQILLAKRSFRVRPGLDDKILTSWNALMIKALAEAYTATQYENYLSEAEKNYAFLSQHLSVDGVLYHTFHYSTHKAKVSAFLDDYSSLAEAAIALYQCTFNDSYLIDAQRLVEEAIKIFFDAETGLFFYNSNLTETLYVRKHEVYDNVIPSSNGVMAMNLYKLGKYFEKEEYLSISLKMLHLMQPKFAGYPSGYSQWLQLQLAETGGMKTVCITGSGALETKQEFDQNYIPNLLFAGGENSTIPLMASKTSTGGNTIHICLHDACLPAVSKVSEAIKLL